MQLSSELVLRPAKRPVVSVTPWNTDRTNSAKLGCLSVFEWWKQLLPQDNACSSVQPYRILVGELGRYGLDGCCMNISTPGNAAESKWSQRRVKWELRELFQHSRTIAFESRLLIFLFLLNIVLYYNAIRMDGWQYLKVCLAEIHESCCLFM